MLNDERRVIAVDPGLVSGAIAVLDHTGNPVELHDMPVDVRTIAKGGKRRSISPAGLVNIFDQYPTGTPVVIEHQQSRPGEGGASTFAAGESYGALRAVPAALAQPLHIVRSQDWTKGLGVGRDKAVHVAKACELWPDWVNEFRGPRGGLHDGKADACLIGHWAVRFGPLR